MKQKLVDQSRACHASKGDKIGQGKANAAKFLDDNPALATEIEDEIRRQTMNLPTPESEQTAPQETAAPVEESVEG